MLMQLYLVFHDESFIPSISYLVFHADAFHSVSKKAYINGDYNIDLLQLHTNTHYNTFYENTTAQGFFPKITRSTRSYGSSIN